MGKVLKKLFVAVLVIVILLGILAAGYAIGKKGLPSFGIGKCEHVYGADDKCTKCGAEKPGEADKAPASGFALMTAKISTEDYAAYNVPEEAEGAWEVSIKFTPEKGKYDSVEWSLDWENSEGEWATGKDTSTYASYSFFKPQIWNNNTQQYEDDKTAVSLAYNGEKFSETILLTCAVKVKEQTLTKTTRVECLSVPTSIWGSTGDNVQTTIESLKDMQLKIDYEWSEGTVKANDYTGDFNIAFNQELGNMLESTYGYKFKNNMYTATYTENLLDEDLAFGIELDKFLEGEYDGVQFWNDFYDIVQSNDSIKYSEQLLYITCDLVLSVGGVEMCWINGALDIKVKDFEDLVTWVTDFEVSKDTVVLF